MKDENLYLTDEIEFKVDFNDCDPMRIVWHGNYINYCERARCSLLDKIGYNYIEMEKSGYMFPVTEVKMKYMHSLRFGDTCRAKAILVEWENLIKINFELYNADTGEMTTKATVSQMCVDMNSGETQFFCPKCWAEKVKKLLESGGFRK
ncbi:MAG: acyl-CoA thioesterase [Treponema sp.]|uniref:acyl-CoA thioesterase n=1 Tax=Treponema sp. TaxID=166 RepID=UPI0025E11533|nr:acyl-CoA thioesterase [Treponema sp.]MBQ9282800.1 acyl-CoA thioesterase [Treponema sp.]